jgi:hypothetical protein
MESPSSVWDSDEIDRLCDDFMVSFELIGSFVVILLWSFNSFRSIEYFCLPGDFVFHQDYPFNGSFWLSDLRWTILSVNNLCHDYSKYSLVSGRSATNFRFILPFILSVIVLKKLILLKNDLREDESDKVKDGYLSAPIGQDSEGDIQNHDFRQLLRLSGGSRSECVPGPTFDDLSEVDSSVEVIESKDFTKFISKDQSLFELDDNPREIECFHHFRRLRVVEIPVSIQVIGYHAFLGCISLTDIRFESRSQVRIIDGFSDCLSLRRIEIASSVQHISTAAFSGCAALNEIVFADDSSLTTINGFSNCTSLSNVEIPHSVEIIFDDAFRRCTSLVQVAFASSCQIRELGGFCQCTALLRIEIPSSVECLLPGAFAECVTLTEVTFASSSHIRQIDGFFHCLSLIRIEIPLSVEIVHGLKECPLLRSVMIQREHRIRDNFGFRECKPFLPLNDDELRQSRRRLHLETLDSAISKE